MRRMSGLFALPVILSTLVAAQSDGLPVDEKRIIAEMDALIDATPELDPKSLEAVRDLIAKGIKAHDAKRFDRAIELYRKALDINPLADNAYYELAYTYMVMGEPEAALDAVIRALTLNPKEEVYYIVKASLLDDLGFREDATKAYRELLEIQPDSYLGHLNLGLTLTRMRKMEEAEAEYLRAIEIEPNHPSAYFHMALLCNTLGYNYDERSYLEKFIERGSEDHRLARAKEWLEELQQYNVEIDPSHPYPEIELIEKLTRVTWKTEEHHKAFPEARGYELTFEEDKDVYQQILALWREKKQEDPEASYGHYDLLLRIDDAGFLDEYIWYHRQKIFGDRAEEWIEAHRDRMDAFLAWAEAEGLMGEEEVQPSLLDRFRALPAVLLEAVDESVVVYELGSESDRPTGLLDDDRDRFARGLKLTGEDRIACGKASKTLDKELSASGARALTPMYRCFAPGEPGYDLVNRRLASLGLEAREIEFRPVADLIPGDKVQVTGDAPWLFYALAKAAWRNEPELREMYGGGEDGEHASLEEEIFALGVVLGSYVNLRDVDETETDGEETPPLEPIPALDRLQEATEAGHFRGYLLYEVIHKAYGLELDRLEQQQAQDVSDYLFAHVIFRTQAGD